MNQNLLRISDDFIEIMKTTDGVLGAWNFGSLIHGSSDAFSDVDLIFLIAGNTFGEMEDQLPVILSGMCDELILCFRESFNSKAIIANSYLLQEQGCVLQFDVVLLNEEYTDNSICRIFYTDLLENNIIFDVDHHVKKLCEDCPHGKLWKNKLERIFTAYVLYFHMTAKYLNRQDYFKLNHAMRMLYDNHVSLLLTGYDAVTWGGAETKLGYLPADKQEHLKKYSCTDDFLLNREHLLQSVKWFEQDMHDVSELKGQKYDTKAIAMVQKNWEKCIAVAEKKALRFL